MIDQSQVLVVMQQSRGNEKRTVVTETPSTSMRAWSSSCSYVIIMSLRWIDYGNLGNGVSHSPARVLTLTLQTLSSCLGNTLITRPTFQFSGTAPGD